MVKALLSCFKLNNETFKSKNFREYEKKIKVLKTLHALIAGRHLIMPHIFTEHIVISVINVPTTAQVAIEKLL